MKKPLDLVSGVKQAVNPGKPQAKDPFVGEPSIPREDVAGTHALAMLATDRAAERYAAIAARREHQKAIAAAEDAKWQEILARRTLHGQLS
jgi:hypothetical protein